ncbi:MAG: hypothetical protein ABIP79_08150 [Chitinophagaceae bacterium]
MKKDNKQSGGITDKKDKNEGSGGFNEGSKQDPDVNDGIKISDYEKRTGHAPSPGKEKPEDGNNGKNNAGGYE